MAPAAASLPSLFPRLIDSLQNIPPIKVRLPVLFPKEAQAGEHGERDNATPTEYATPAPGGVSLTPPPGFFDNGLVFAVPKKKVSHQKKRQRQLAPNKQLKEIKSLSRCSSCGHIKRTHHLCMHCVGEIKRVFKERERAAIELAEADKPKEALDELTPEDERVIYPGKYLSEEQEKLQKREYLYKRKQSLPYWKK